MCVGSKGFVSHESWDRTHGSSPMFLQLLCRSGMILRKNVLEEYCSALLVMGHHKRGVMGLVHTIERPCWVWTECYLQVFPPHVIHPSIFTPGKKPV